MIPLWLTDWIAPRLFKLAGSGLVAVIGVSACMVRDASLQKKGGEKRQAQIEKATDNASKAGKRAADRAADPGVRGRRDPSTRDD